jgi:hypothetical protein
LFVNPYAAIRGIHYESQGLIREEFGNIDRNILLYDLPLPLLSFVIMTIYHEIPRLLVKRDTAMMPDNSFDINDQRE